MRKYTLHVGWIFFDSLVIVLVGALQVALSNNIKDDTKTASNVACKLQDVRLERESLRLDLSCGDKKAYISKVEHVAQYWLNPGPLSCTLFKSGRAECTRVTN